VPIYVTNSDPIALLEFDLVHSSYLDFRGVEPTSRMVNATIESNAMNSTVVKVAALIPGNISYGSGAIMNMLFDVDLLSVPGFYQVTIQDAFVTNVEINDIPVETETGIFTII
jgi:hypothetical protein